MAIVNIVGQMGRLVVAAAGLAGVTLTAGKPGMAVDAGTAVGLGPGAAAPGAAGGSAANPYNNPYYYPPGYAYPAPGYYYPAAPYYPPRRCWDPYYRRYY